MAFNHKDYIKIAPESEWVQNGFTHDQYQQIVSYFETLDNAAVQQTIATAFRDQGRKISIVPALPMDTHYFSANFEKHLIQLRPEAFDPTQANYSSQTGDFFAVTLANTFPHEFVHLTKENWLLHQDSQEMVETDAMLKTNAMLPNVPARTNHGLSGHFDATGPILPKAMANIPTHTTNLYGLYGSSIPVVVGMYSKMADELDKFPYYDDLLKTSQMGDPTERDFRDVAKEPNWAPLNQILNEHPELGKALEQSRV
ncbi:MAG: hypothetical protein B7X02_01735, partial [Rhodospirillales bacterium 12-54-5]